MNCEQVEELLSAYLDDSLAWGETAESASELQAQIAAHLQDCIHCSTVLADYRRFDALLEQMPRVYPSQALRERIFSSPEYLELTGTYNIAEVDKGLDLTVPYKSVRHDTPSHPQLVALPGGRRVTPDLSSTSTAQALPSLQPGIQKRHKRWGLRIMQVAIAATLLLTLGIGSLISWNLWTQNTRPVSSNNTITPPAAPALGGPLPAGIYYVFLRDGSLWSAPADGTTKAKQLTPQDVTVGEDWVVSPPLPERSAGNMLAYIDLQHAFVHTIRSDGQSDTAIRQPLLKAGISASSVWDTSTGAAILDSLTWSKNGSMLAFVADPTGSGATNLYILSTETGTVQMVPLPIKGSVSHPLWSPDGIRIAFELSHNGVTGILDYNIQNHGLLVITNNINVQGRPNDTVLSLDWSPSADTPAITWSVGTIGHVHSIWLRRVGNGGNGNAFPQEITQGDYVQAIYSQAGHGGIGSWLLVTSFLGRAANLWCIDLIPGAIPTILTRGKQVNFAQWSPDGMHIDYLDSISSGIGALHIVNTTTMVDTLVTGGVANEPTPAWSTDSQQLVYSTGKQSVTVDIQGRLKLHPLTLHGLASTFSWSVSSPHQLIVALNDVQTGIYLIDTQHNTAYQVDKETINGSIIWTEIP